MHKGILLIVVWMSSLAWAGGVSDIGLGGSVGNLASAGSITDRHSAFLAFQNPSLLAMGERVQLEFGTHHGGVQYDSMGGILLDSPEYRTEDGVERRGDFKLATSQEAFWTAGVSLPYSIQKAGGRRLGFGISLFGPYERVRRFVSKTPFDFMPLRFLDPQFKATVAAAFEVIPKKLFVGAGTQFYVTSSGTGDALLLTENPTGRFLIDVGLNSSLLLGLGYELGDSTFGFVYRQAVNPKVRQEFSARAQIIKGMETIEVPAILQAVLYYEPESFELEWKKKWSNWVTSIGILYEVWTRFEPSYTRVETQGPEGETYSTVMPTFPLRNIFIPRVSLEKLWAEGKLSTAVGYRYRPTPLTDLSGPSNLIDTDQHLLGLSVKWKLPDPFELLTLGVLGQVHFLSQREVKKADLRYIGAPGYRIGGTGYFTGLTLEAAL